PLHLSAAEQAWLRAHPVIRVAADPSYAPFEFNNKGIFRGMSIDYLRAAGKRLGVRFDISTGRSWQAVAAMIKERRLDIFSCVVKTPQRQKYVRFTRPYLSFPVTIFTRYNAPYIAALGELKGKKVAVVRDYYLQDLLKRDYPGILLLPVKNIEAALHRVAAGDAYAFLGNIAAVSFYIHKLGYTNIKVAGESAYRANLSMAVRRDWPQFAPLLQKALDSMSREERNRIYRKWISLRYEKAGNYRYLWQGLAAFLLLLAVIIYWNRRLSQRVEERTRELEAEKAFSEAVINGLPGVFFMYLVDKNGKMREIRWNKNHETATGYSGEEIEGMSPDDWFRDEDLEKAYAEINRVVSGESVVTELPIINKDGTCVPYLLSAMPLKADGKDYLIGFGIDISDRKKTEKALTASEKRYVLAQRAANIGSWEWNPQTDELHWSRDTEPLFGFPSGGLSDTVDTFMLHIHPDDKKRFKESLMAARKKNEEYNFQFRLIRPDGEQRWLQTIGGAVADKGGDPDRMIGIIQDITERKQLDEIMVQTEKMMSVGGLAAGMAHEINNPLAGIMQNIQVLRLYLLEDTPKNRRLCDEYGISFDKLQEFYILREVPAIIDNILDAGSRAAKVVSNMLSFSRKTTSGFIPCHLDEIIDKSIEIAENDYELNYDFRCIEIIREYASGVSQVRCDPSLIQQVFLNILKNGAQAMLREQREGAVGEGAARFIMRVRQTGQRVVVEIEDNGSGMDEVTRKRIFEPFFTTKGVGVGTGLGLSVSYFIITEKHGGIIRVESAPQRGTKFIISLPIYNEGNK
ncbi:MAG: transporter substrate-binding domain-containing protein, partial [Deltaproteobacteria bacterium]|nr:transporter substrate-binding domain-containing protein [Deltaproteobacteria bacterium]